MADAFASAVRGYFVASAVALAALTLPAQHASARCYPDATGGGQTCESIPVGAVGGTGGQVTVGAGSAIIGKVGIDQTTPGTTDSVTVATGQGAGAAIGATTGAAVTTDANGTIQQYLRGLIKQWTAGTLVVGTGANTIGAVTQASGPWTVNGPAASGATVSGNPMQSGGRAQTAEPTAVANGQAVAQAFDLTGKAITSPYANPENFENGTTAAITDTTSTAVIASAGGSLRHYVAHCQVSNSHATVGTFVKILDGASIIYEGYAAAAGGGFVSSFPVPLRGTAATALNCQAVTTGANFICSCSGYKGI